MLILLLLVSFLLLTLWCPIVSAAVASLHAVAGFTVFAKIPAFDGVLVVASFPAAPGVPILAGGFVEWEVHITLSDYRNIAIGLYFFLLANYRNIKYRIGEFKELSDYRIKVSIYRTIGYRTKKKLSVAHLQYVVTRGELILKCGSRGVRSWDGKFVNLYSPSSYFGRRTSPSRPVTPNEKILLNSLTSIGLTSCRLVWDNRQ